MKKQPSLGDSLVFTFTAALVQVLLFPVYCVTVLYLSIRSLVKRENIDP